MKFNKTVLAILAIFIVIMGAAAVSADDIGQNPTLGDDDDQGDTLGDDQDDDDNQDDNQDDDQEDDEEEEVYEENPGEEGMDVAVGASADENETAPDGPEVISTANGNEETTADDSANATASADNATAAQNNIHTASAGGDANKAVTDHATGNPIFILLVVLAVLGIYPLRR